MQELINARNLNRGSVFIFEGVFHSAWVINLKDKCP